MRKFLTISILFIWLGGYSQTISEPNKLWPRSNFRPPLDTTLAPERIGELRYRTADAKFYKAISLTGLKWSEFGVSGVTPSLQDVTTVGSTTSTGATFFTNNNTSGFKIDGVVANYGSQYMGYGLNSSDLTNRVSNTHGGIAILFDTRSGISPYRMFLYPAGSGTSKQVFAIDELGAISFPQYGIGAVTGTPVYNLSVNSSGKVIETTYGLGYTEYVAIISQSGTSAPTATVIKNDIGSTPTYSRTNTGIYNIVFTGTPLKSGKTVVTTQISASGDGCMNVSNINGGSDVASLTLYYFLCSTGAAIDNLDKMMITIRVYP